MIRAGLTLGDDAIVESGRQALELVLDRGYQPGRGSRHVIEPNPNPRVFLTAQADVALGLLDAYETTGDLRYLEAAQDIVTFTMRNLRVTGESALRDFLAESNPLGLLANPRWPLRPNTRMARAALRLAFHGRGDAYRDVSRVILSFYAGDLGPFRVHGVETALAVEEWIRDPLVIRIDGNRDQTAKLRRQAIFSPWPWTIVTTGTDDASPAAELTFRDRTERVTDPAALGEAIQRLTGGQP